MIGEKRRTKATERKEERQEQVLSFLSSLHLIKDALALAGVPRGTYDEWLRDPEFAARADQASTAAKERALSVIREELGVKGKRGKESARVAMWLLERRFPSEYGAKSSVEDSHPPRAIGLGISAEEAAVLTTEELEALDQAEQIMLAAKERINADGSLGGAG